MDLSIEMFPMVFFECFRCFFCFGSAEASAASLQGRHGASYKKNDIVFLFEVAFVNLLRIEQVNIEMVVFHDPAHPASSHRSAIGIPKGDAGGLHPDHVFCCFYVGSQQVRTQ